MKMGRHTQMSVWPAVLGQRSPARVLANQHKPSNQVSHSRLGCIGMAGRVGYCTVLYSTRGHAVDGGGSLSQAVGTGYLHACPNTTQMGKLTRAFQLLFLLIDIAI